MSAALDSRLAYHNCSEKFLFKKIKEVDTDKERKNREEMDGSSS